MNTVDVWKWGSILYFKCLHSIKRASSVPCRQPGGLHPPGPISPAPEAQARPAQVAHTPVTCVGKCSRSATTCAATRHLPTTLRAASSPAGCAAPSFPIGRAYTGTWRLSMWMLGSYSNSSNNSSWCSSSNRWYSRGLMNKCRGRGMELFIGMELLLKDMILCWSISLGIWDAYIYVYMYLFVNEDCPVLYIEGWTYRLFLYRLW